MTLDVKTLDKQATKAAPKSEHEIATAWLAAFEKAMAAGDRAALSGMFIEDSHWRDLFIFTWTITPRSGRDNVVDAVIDFMRPNKPHGFKVSATRTQPKRVVRAGVTVIETIFEFETPYASGAGVLRQPVDAPEKAWSIHSSLEELHDAPWPVGKNRPTGQHDRLFGGDTKAKRREKEMEYSDREPTVVVIGGGHNGVITAAQLRMLGVDALVVEKFPRVGDVWRNRYASLALHNKVHLNHLPFLKYPETAPLFLTKDTLGDWIENYAKVMDVNVWTGSEVLGARWIESKKAWAVTIRRADGSERVVHPRHLVMANGGIVGTPRHPDFPGLKDFGGDVIHSHGYVSGEKWRGKNVIIIGVGNTAHDIAQDLHGFGAKVTMVQRGSITVHSVDAVTLNHALYYNNDMPVEDCDLIANHRTWPVAVQGLKLNVAKMKELDKDLLEGLRARGMKLDMGEEEAGHQVKVMKQHGGYYLNVGCSDLIVNGEVGLVQYEDIDKFEAEGLRLKDGRLLKADLVVTATGYEDPLKDLGRLVGEDVAGKIGPIWGLDDQDQELQNMYKPTKQQGLWFIAGGFAQGRVWSRALALQIAARERGLVKDPIPALA